MDASQQNGNNFFKFCPFCPEPLDDDRQVLIHAIGDHTAEYLKLKNEESLDCIFQKLPAIKGTILEKRILAKRRRLDDENDDVLRGIEFISGGSKTKNEETAVESAPSSCCSSGYHSGNENDQNLKNDHQNIDDKIENQVQQQQSIDKSIILDQNRSISEENPIDNRSIISIPETDDNNTLNDDMDVLFGENGFFAINDEISTILTENIANRETLTDPPPPPTFVATPQPQPRCNDVTTPPQMRCNDVTTPPQPRCNDLTTPQPSPDGCGAGGSLLKSLLNGGSTLQAYRPQPQACSFFPQQMTTLLRAAPQPPPSPSFDSASRRRPYILPTPQPQRPMQPLMTTTTPPQRALQPLMTQPQKRRKTQSGCVDYKRADLMFGGTSLTFVDVVVCRVCRIVAGPAEQVLRHELAEHRMPRYLCPAAACSLFEPGAGSARCQVRCYNSFPDVDYLRQHVRQGHPDFRGPFVCPFCRSSCLDFEAYASHAQQEYDIRRRRFYRQLTKRDVSIRCKQCKVVAITQLSWLRHRCRCQPDSPYAQSDAQMVARIEAELNLAPPDRPYSCPHNRTICEKYPACYFDEDGFLKLANECPMAHPACDAPNGVCRTPGCFDHHQNQGAKFCRACHQPPLLVQHVEIP